MSVRIGVSGIRRQWGGAERQGVNSAYVPFRRWRPAPSR